jgi:site-specific recombinase XerD
MERGTSLRYIQVALSHNSSKTAEIYTRVLAMNNKTIISPLDTMYESVSLEENKTTS